MQCRLVGPCTGPCLKRWRSVAGGPALQTAEMRLAGGAGSSFTYFAHLQLCHVCSGCRVSYMRDQEYRRGGAGHNFFVLQPSMRCDDSRQCALTWNGDPSAGTAGAGLGAAPRQKPWGAGHCLHPERAPPLMLYLSAEALQPALYGIIHCCLQVSQSSERNSALKLPKRALAELGNVQCI